MSIQPPTINRTPPAADRGSQRADRAPAGDFAALLDLLPAAPAATGARAAQRDDRDRGLESQPQRQATEAGRPRRDYAAADGLRADAAGGHRADAAGGHRGDGVAADVACHVAHAGAAPTDGTPVPQPEPATPGSGATSSEADQPGMLGQLAPAALTSPVADLLAAAATVAAPAVAAPAVAATADGSEASAGEPASGGAPAAEPTPPGASAVAVAADGPLPAQAAGPGATAEVPAGSPAAAPGAAVDANAPTSASASTDGAFALPAEALETAAQSPAVAPAAAETAAAETPAAPIQPRNSETAAPAGEPALPAAATGAGHESAGSGADQRGDAPASRTDTAPVPAPASSSQSTAALQALARPLDGMPLGTHRAVPLERAPRAVAQLLHVGSQSGVSHARIALRPVELGGIEIFLQSSPAGLVAQVVAESPEAARMLQQATEDLRRALAGHDVELVSLDVSTSSERQQRDDFAAREAFEDSPIGGRSRERSRDAGSDASAQPDPPTPTVLELPDGLLVDVLA